MISVLPEIAGHQRSFCFLGATSEQPKIIRLGKAAGQTRKLA
jgi:hypothetical protein